MFAVVDLILEIDLADVDRVLQQAEEAAFGEWLTSFDHTFSRNPLLSTPAAAVDLPDRRQQHVVFKVELKDQPHSDGLVCVDGQATASLVDVVTQYRAPADPFALAPCRRHFVARSLGDDLPLELGEG